MKPMTIGISRLICVGMAGAALANPALLPKHAGYPSGGDFANDKASQKNRRVEIVVSQLRLQPFNAF